MSLGPRRSIGGGGGGPPPQQDEAFVVRQLLQNLTALETQVEGQKTSLAKLDGEWRETQRSGNDLDDQLRDANADLAREELEEARLKLEIVTLRNAYEAGTFTVAQALCLFSSTLFYFLFLNLHLLNFW